MWQQRDWHSAGTAALRAYIPRTLLIKPYGHPMLSERRSGGWCRS